jgi:hypothetical protein
MKVIILIKFNTFTLTSAAPIGGAVYGVGLRLLASWDCGFESHGGHGCSSVVSIVWCQVEVFATSWSLVWGVRLTVVRHCVWSRTCVNEEALVHWGLSRPKQTNKQNMTSLSTNYNSYKHLRLSSLKMQKYNRPASFASLRIAVSLSHDDLGLTWTLSWTGRIISSRNETNGPTT